MKTELLQAARSFGWRFGVCGLLPLLVGCLFALLRALAGWEMQEPLFVKYFVFFVALLLVAAFYPGRYLERTRSQGSPFGATLFVLCLALPLALCLLLALSDGLAALTLGSVYGPAAFPLLFPALRRVLQELVAETGFSLCTVPALVLYLWWTLTVLAFAAGTLLFRSESVVKTVFALFGLALLFVLTLVLVAGRIPGGESGLQEWGVAVLARRLALRVRVAADIFLGLQALACLFVIYRRSRGRSAYEE